MKSRTISKIIETKINHWLESISDANLKMDLREGVIVTGGCITSMLLNEDVNDFDLYFKNQDLVARVAKYYVAEFMKNPPPAWTDSDGKLGHAITVQEVAPEDGKMGSVKVVIKSAGVIGENSQKYDYFEATEGGDSYVEQAVTNAEETEIEAGKKGEKSGKYRPIFMTCNSITLYGRVQLVLRFFGEPDEIHRNYDFAHCTNYWTYKNGLVLNPKALECILSKELVYQGSLYPVCSLFRIRKFMKRGWTITAGQVLKMAFQVSKLNLEDVAVLEDQLVGVDAAYFQELIGKLKAENKETVDGAYLMALIEATL